MATRKQRKLEKAQILVAQNAVQEAKANVKATKGFRKKAEARKTLHQAEDQLSSVHANIAKRKEAEAAQQRAQRQQRQAQRQQQQAQRQNSGRGGQPQMQAGRRRPGLVQRYIQNEKARTQRIKDITSQPYSSNNLSEEELWWGSLSKKEQEQAKHWTW